MITSASVPTQTHTHTLSDANRSPPCLARSCVCVCGLSLISLDRKPISPTTHLTQENFSLTSSSKLLLPTQSLLGVRTLLLLLLLLVRSLRFRAPMTYWGNTRTTFSSLLPKIFSISSSSIISVKEIEIPLN